MHNGLSQDDRRHRGVRVQQQLGIVVDHGHVWARVLMQNTRKGSVRFLAVTPIE
jgi:hypothetical protein